jgi:solute:Na+ symporter, SSS family
VIVAYVALMLGMGAALSRNIRRFRDYFLAGGALTTPLLVCTLVSTYYEIDVTFGTSEVGYYHGLAAWFWFSRPYYLTIFLAALIVVKRVKARGRDFMSLPDVLEQAYGKGSRIAGALACFVYSLPITALAGMTALSEVLGWPAWAGLLVGVSVCAAYMTMGGLWADAISDTVQFVLMSVTLAVAIPLALDSVGGFSFTTHLPAAHMTATGGLSPWLLAAYAMTALTVLVEPQFYQRIFAARDPQAVTRALLIGIVLWASYDWGVTLLGMVARAAVAQGMLPADIEGRHALLAVVLPTLPVAMKGMFIAGVLAAAMSSIDSYALIASGNLVYDIWRPLARRKPDDATLLRYTRWGVFGVLVAAALASLAFPRISDAWVLMASFLTSVALVPVMAAIFLKPKRAAGLAASVAGLAALVAFYAAIFAFGEYAPAQQSWVLRLGGAEIWREFAALVALPFSIAGLALGNLFGRERSTW